VKSVVKIFLFSAPRLPPRPLRLRVSLHPFPSPISNGESKTRKTKMKYKLTFALVASLTSTAFAAFQAPLPEFKNEKQLAEWRAEKASEATSQGYVAEEAAFYTGRPYLASFGAYAFKYRSYNPELARWTSDDPSGFPDGANQSVYAPNPTSEFDFMGLYSDFDKAYDISLVGVVIAAWDTLGYTMAVSNANHSLDFGDDRSIPDSHLTSLTESSKFTDQFNKSWFDNYYGTRGTGTYNYTQVVNYGKTSDLGNSYGNVGYAFTVNVSHASIGYKYVVDFSTPTEFYDFSPSSSNPAIAAFSRLQANGFARAFLSSSSFQKTYESHE
jgi:RHS repeat-associated protein